MEQRASRLLTWWFSRGGPSIASIDKFAQLGSFTLQDTSAASSQVVLQVPCDAGLGPNRLGLQTIHHGTWIDAHAVRFQINILKKHPYWETTHDWTSFAGPADFMCWLREFVGLSAHLQVLVTLRNKCRATHHKYAHLQLSESTGSQGKLKMASSQCAYKKNTKSPNHAMWQSMTDMFHNRLIPNLKQKWIENFFPHHPTPSHAPWGLSSRSARQTHYKHPSTACP